MKPIALLVILLGTLLAGMAIILNAPPFVDPPVRFIVGAGLLGTMAVVLGGPIGKGLAAQLKGDATGSIPEGRLLAQLEELSQDMQALRDDLGQLHERMDFTERLLTQQNQEPRLRAGERGGQ